MAAHIVTDDGLLLRELRLLISRLGSSSRRTVDHGAGVSLPQQPQCRAIYAMHRRGIAIAYSPTLRRRPAPARRHGRRAAERASVWRRVARANTSTARRRGSCFGEQANGVSFAGTVGIAGDAAPRCP